MNVRPQRPRHGERGQVVPLVALATTVLLGFAVLALDVGYLRFQQRIQQIAADSAAIAGAQELLYATPGWNAGATGDATLNGYTDDKGANVTVAVNHPPKSGAYSANGSAVEVIISKKQPMFFLPAFSVGAQKPWITTRAVAALNPNALGCLITLHGGLTLNGGGGGGISAPNCGIEVNGDLCVNGNANVTARFIGYLGSGPCKGVYTNGAPVKITQPAIDPCASVASCKYLATLDVTKIACADSLMTVTASLITLPPGRYCTTTFNKGKLKNTPVAMVPTSTSALYVFDQDIPDTANTTGTGVTIYNHTAGGATWNGTTVVSVSAPTNTAFPYSGMVWYQPPSDSGADTVNGNSASISFTGGFYAPTAAVTLNANIPSVNLLVVGSAVMNGGGMNVTSSTGLQITGHAVLAE